MKKLVYFIVLAALIFQTGFLSGIPVGAQGEITDPPTPTVESTPTPESTETALPTASPTATETLTPTEIPATVETASPIATSVVTDLALVLSTTPTDIRRGKELTIDWSIEGLGEIANGMILRFILPKDITAIDPQVGIWDKKQNTLDVEITGVKGSIGFMVGEKVKSPLVITAELLRDGISLTKGEVNLLDPDEIKIDKKGGKAKGLRGSVEVTFPEGALQETVKVKISKPSKESLPVKSLSGSAFELTAVSESTTQEVSTFDQPVEIQVRYSEAGMASEDDLRLYWYDSKDGYWKQVVNQHVDPETNTLVAYVDHFTVFDAYNSNWQTAETPSLESFQHSGFTGGASFSMPIKVPPGPGGFQPSLTLSYSSSVVDNAGSQTQASWAGMGWSLSPSFIERNGHGTNSTLDDSYSVNLNGMSMELLPGADGKYHASDENFYKVEFVVPNYDELQSTWTIWDKSGNQYIFDTRIEFLESKPCEENPDLIDFKSYVWRWSLTKVVNNYGKEMLYTYQNDTKTLEYRNCNGRVTSTTANTWAHPSTITYANGKYQILFTRIARTDYLNLWESPYNYSYTAYQKSLLRTIQVLQDSNSDGTFSVAGGDTLVRKYVFTYASDVADYILSDLVWEAGGRTPTLIKVQEYGLGGTNALPAYTFTYGDDMHLTSASNGYGGTATFTYNNWKELMPYQDWGGADSIATESEIPYWGNPILYKFNEWAEGWVAFGTYPNTVTYNSGGAGSITVTGTARNPNTGYGAAAFQPGRWYMILASAKATSGTGNTMRVGLRYKKADGTYQSLYGDYVPLITSYRTISSGLIFLPTNATSMEPLIQSLPSPGGSNTVDWYAVYPLTTAYRVTSRTLSTGSDSYTFTYDYSGAATNSPAISAEAAGDHPYTRAYTEFRGHSQVTETDPYGKKVVTNYNQDDCYSGRSSVVTIKDAANNILQQTQSEYACTETNSTILLKDKDTRNPVLYDTYFDPIKYRWVRTAFEGKDVYGGTPNGVAATLTTTYDAYDAYGNLTQKTVSGTGIETTTTYTQYFPNTSQWLVGLPARTYVKDSQNVTLSLSMNLYDSASTYNTAPTQGVLMATRTLMSGTSYAQTSYGHDAWGNVTSQTVWTGYGTASTAPTEGAQTTYTCYGTGESIGGKWCANDGYRTYALWTKNAKGHISYVTYDYSLGLPLTETDPNGAVTSATYDVFGRFKSLTKPGETSPSLNVSYVNNPFKVTLTQAIDATHTFTVVRNYDGMGRQTSTVTNGVTTTSTFNAYGKPLMQSTPYASGETAYTTATTYDALGRPLTVTVPDSTQTTYAYDGLTTSVTDANNHTHTTVTDILGRTLSVTPPTGPAVTFTYDPLGNMLTAERGGTTVILTYDKASRKLTMNDPDMGNWSYAYNALGGMTSQTDARGCVTSITYDELNRPTGKTYSNCPSTPSVTYTYDAGTNGKGRRTSMSVTGADLTQWVYDERGRVTSENKQITDGGQFVTAFTYNSADLPVTMTYPDNEVVTFSYNNNMLPTSVGGTDTYAQSIAYDSAMRMIQLVRGANKVNTVFDYNDWNADGGRLLNLTSTQVSTGTPLQNSTYDYDAVGNINTIVDSLMVQTQAFQYDALDRLTNSTVTGGENGTYTEGYTYESGTGNLSSKNSVGYTYDATHKHAVASLSNGNTYGYDQNGNMTSRHVRDRETFQDFTLNYDAENRLVSVSGAATANFTYDGDGKQIKATVNGTTTVYVGNHYEVKNSVVTKYYFAGTTRLAVRTGETLKYLLSDHLGSTTLSTDANGTVSASALYKAFGELRITPSDLGTDYKFTGQREEASLGIYFFNARWYDSSLGRFLSPDSIVPTSTQGTQAWDRYAFVNNNPVRYTDPTGHQVTNDDGGTKYSYEQTQYDRQRMARELCKSGDANYCSGVMNGGSRPITGIHFGTEVTMDVFVGGYTYQQTDYLFDWKSGSFYRTNTTGNGYYLGALNGASLEFYGGTTNVHGIPLSATPEQVNNYLAGENIDFSADIGLDVADLDGNVGKGLSVDLDPVSGDPMITSAGYMYATENKIALGVSALPFSFEGGLQWGRSQTTSSLVYQIPWWPFQ